MVKKLLLLFLMFSSFSFARYVNACVVIRKHSDYSFQCQSLESGKDFLFTVQSPKVIQNFKVGYVYKVWFNYDDEGYYDVYDWKFLYKY